MPEPYSKPPCEIFFHSSYAMAWLRRKRCMDDLKVIEKMRLRKPKSFLNFYFPLDKVVPLKQFTTESTGNFREEKLMSNLKPEEVDQLSGKQARLKKLSCRLHHLLKLLRSTKRIEIDEKYLTTALRLETMSKYDKTGNHALQQLISINALSKPLKKNGIRYWNVVTLASHLSHLEGTQCKVTL